MPHLHVRRDGALAEIVLDRPKVNAMNRQFLGELRDAFGALAADDAVRGVLLRAEGSCFSAGLDLRELAGLDEAGAGAFLDAFDAAFGAAFAFPKPLAVAAHGHTIAGGLVLALAGDFVAFRSDAGLKVGLTELKVGVPFPRVAFEIVSHAVAGRGARTMRFSAELYPIERAFGFGVGDALVADPVSAARAWLEAIAARPLATVRFVKQQDREAPLARVAAATLRERRALVDAILGAKDALVRALG